MAFEDLVGSGLYACNGFSLCSIGYYFVLVVQVMDKEMFMNIVSASALVLGIINFVRWYK